MCNNNGLEYLKLILVIIIMYTITFFPNIVQVYISIIINIMCDHMIIILLYIKYNGILV